MKVKRRLVFADYDPYDENQTLKSQQAGFWESRVGVLNEITEAVEKLIATMDRHDTLQVTIKVREPDDE